MKTKYLIFFTIIAICFFRSDLYSGYRPNGGCFTPKGEFRVLVVFVGYGDNDTLLKLDNWPHNQPFPSDVMQGTVFYDDFAMFDTNSPLFPINPVRDGKNVSRWFYEMSKHSANPLKLMVDTVRVDIDKTYSKEFVNVNFLECVLILSKI